MSGQENTRVFFCDQDTGCLGMRDIGSKQNGGLRESNN